MGAGANDDGGEGKGSIEDRPAKECCKTMSFETKRITLAAGAAPIDLAADPDWGLSNIGINQVWAAVQNVSTRTVRFAETATAPAGTATDEGHTLPPGAGVVVLLSVNVPFWWWSSTGAAIAVSEGSPVPTRG